MTYPAFFDEVETAARALTIRELLMQRARAKAAQQYVRILASKATIEGIDLGAAASPLVE